MIGTCCATMMEWNCFVLVVACLGNGSSTVVETKLVLCFGWLQKMIHSGMLYTVYMLIIIILRSSSIKDSQSLCRRRIYLKK